jgi:hypothetical protein
VLRDAVAVEAVGVGGGIGKDDDLARFVQRRLASHEVLHGEVGREGADGAGAGGAGLPGAAEVRHSRALRADDNFPAWL